MTASLNSTILNYQKQLDAHAAQHGVLYDQDNPLQTMVENLTAKNKELEL